MHNLLSIAACLCCAVTLSAAPLIREMVPRGAQRGKTLQLVLKGVDLAEGAAIHTTLPASISRLAPSKDVMRPGTELPFLVEVKQDAPVGLYPIRVLTEDGLSNVVLFSVGQLPEIQEKESENPKQTNGEVKLAEAVTSPAVINGTLEDADVDVYSFQARAGQKLVFEVEASIAGSAIDPAIELLEAGGKVIAKNDDSLGNGIDSRLEHAFTRPGTYYVRIHDSKFSSQEQNFYRLKIGSYTFAEAMFPLGWRRSEPVSVQLLGGNLAQPVTVMPDTSGPGRFARVGVPGSASLPQLFLVSDKPEMLEPEGEQRTLTPGAIMNGRIGKKGEVDRYKLKVKPGDQWIFELRAASTGASQLDALLTLHDSEGKKLESRDDLGGSDPALPFEVPKGVEEVTVAVEDLLGRGGDAFGYRLEARRESADFSVAITTPFVNVPAGGTAILSARIQRRGYDGAMQLRIKNLPSGFRQAGGTVAPAAAIQRFDDPNPRFGVNTSTITITADPDVPAQSVGLVVVATADLPDGGRIVRYAESPGLLVVPRGVRARAITASWLEMPVMMATAKPLGVRLSTPVQDVRISQGVEYPLNYKVEGAAAVRLNSRLRENIATQVGNLRILQGPPAKSPNAGTLLLATNFATPATAWDLLPQITVDINGKPVEIYGPMVTIHMAPGYQVWPDAKQWTATPGSRFTMAGRVHREPTFEGGLVKLEVQDLPEGVRCEPVDVPADQRNFTIACEALSSAPKGTHEVRLVSHAPETGNKAKDTYKGPEVSAALRIQ
jgi:hypothetical protein